MNKIITLLSLAILTFLITDCFSQTTEFNDTSEKIDTAEVSFKPNILPGLNVPKLNAGNMNIDGVLNEDVWNNAVTAENFTEISPGDNVKPEVETKVKIFYDDDYIYFGYTCYEKDMESVRASLSDRDRMYGDDWVGPFIDTYSDLKQGFEMYVNPKGIQGDLLWTSNSEDSNYDIIYDSEAKMYKDKWTAEMRIPFKSLRFPDRKEQKWRIHLLRNRPRGARQEIYWASVSRDNPNFMGQSGTLNGIKDVKRGRDIQILPYVLGTQNSTLEDFSDPNSKFTHGKLEGEIGLSAKYGLSSTLTLDATYNPDFSQVEADAPQININSPFALFYPEKRPFFLEGIDHFATPINVSYTRSINNPLFAAKLSGKINKLDIGFISAYDENTPYIIPLTERSFFLSSNKNSVSNILRMKYDMGGENYLGFIFSDREQSADSSKAFGFTGFNRNYGFDGKFNFASNYYLTFQILQNNTKEINDTNFKYNSLKNFRFDDNKYTALLDGESYSGSNVYLSFNRNARNWSFYSEYFFQAPTVRRDNGFIQRNNFHQLFMQQEYNFYPEGKVLRRVNPELNMEIRYDAKGKLKEQFVELNLVTDWTNGIYSSAGYLPVNNEDYGGIFHKNINRWHFNMEANNLSKFITGGFYYEGGKFIVRFEDPTYVGFGHNLDIWATIKPFDRLRNDINYSYSELSKSAGGEKLFAGYVVSDKISYQFNKNFFLRVLLQYDLFSRNFTVDPLLSYKWNPYTILFLGSSHDISEISDNNGFGKYTETDRYFYLKFQYLWSL
ncbi:MAG: carbohydrate binding family 9 domain-containing protein [Ignavibacteria bacterium]|nr:carbohydrate binding family 9 domain-containing protein [Ignavibacteria bacterium]